jgi:hypothetical protein
MRIFIIIMMNHYNLVIRIATLGRDKIQIIKNLETDFQSGMLSWSQMRWIILNCRYGSYTCEKIVDKLIFSKKLKVNPITLDTRTFYKKPSAFDL